jgi:thymidylate synthase
MNMFGFTLFNRDVIAAGVAKRVRKPVKLGRMNWHADSWHIYGKDIETAKQQLFDRLDSMSLEERTYNFHDPFIQDMFNEAETRIVAKIKEYDESH